MNLSSQAGKHGFPLRSAYAAAKWGVIVSPSRSPSSSARSASASTPCCPAAVAGMHPPGVIEAKGRKNGLSFKEQETAFLP